MRAGGKPTHSKLREKVKIRKAASGGCFCKNCDSEWKERKWQKFEAKAEHRLRFYEEFCELFYPHRIKETETK